MLNIPDANLNKGFCRVLEIVKPEFTYVVAPVQDKYSIEKKVIVYNIIELIEILTTTK